jgi:hypothetical protein
MGMVIGQGRLLEAFAACIAKIPAQTRAILECAALEDFIV